MRGYGASLGGGTRIVTDECLAKNVGDEPLLLKQKTDCPLVIGKNRPLAVSHLLKSYPQINIIISDDGLQHYALARDIEIAVLDGQRRLGNGYCFPVGPL
ncbi:MAG TPA: tetraacyldisaccharide 4'-kinase, partial [Candidatus Berkiella sp.]|nr:tetraacyldisaccharide 4'-kinase [Candidatus Berkiella sp.]